MARRDPLDKPESALRKYALGFPEAVEDHPWGESAFKVRGKVFVFLSRHDGGMNVTVKLPESNAEALGFPFCTPTGYGLGKSGWVTARFTGENPVPVELLEEWIVESFRAVAPKRVLAAWDGVPATGGAKSRG